MDFVDVLTSPYQKDLPYLELEAASASVSPMLCSALLQANSMVCLPAPLAQVRLILQVWCCDGLTACPALLVQPALPLSNTQNANHYDDCRGTLQTPG